MNLKYIDNQGKEHFLNSYKINNVIISQEKGQSEADVMSQKAVTDELEKLEQKITDIDVSEQLKDYALTSDVDSKLSDKADKSELNNYYTKSESDGKYLTQHQSLENYFTKEEIEEFFEEINSKDFAELIDVPDKDGFKTIKTDGFGLLFDCGEYSK